MRMAYARGLTQTLGGNASILDDYLNLIYITPRGVPKHSLSPFMISIVSLDGRTLWGEPSSELTLHLEVYRRIESARAILHLHPPLTLAVAEQESRLSLESFTEASARVKCIARIPYIKPGTRELAETVGATLEKTGCNIAILEKHGVVVYSERNLYDALDVVEALEDLSRMIISRRL